MERRRPEPGSAPPAAPPAVEAAGGIVTRDGSGGLEVLLVHRPRYGDWSLPKGKLAPGERHEAAALREVEEETGVACALTGSAGELRYQDRGGRLKRVTFYWMRPLAGDPADRPPDREVDAAAWVGLAEARARLSYPLERGLLDSLR
jgi:8-oxo-dGTP diphosphatase